MAVNPADKAFQLRVPKDLHAEIKHLATVNRRSVNAEIVVMIERVVAENTKTKNGPAQG